MTIYGKKTSQLTPAQEAQDSDILPGARGNQNWSWQIAKIAAKILNEFANKDTLDKLTHANGNLYFDGVQINAGHYPGITVISSSTVIDADDMGKIFILNPSSSDIEVAVPAVSELSDKPGMPTTFIRAGDNDYDATIIAQGGTLLGQYSNIILSWPGDAVNLSASNLSPAQYIIQFSRGFEKNVIKAKSVKDIEKAQARFTQHGSGVIEITEDITLAADLAITGSNFYIKSASGEKHTINLNTNKIITSCPGNIFEDIIISGDKANLDGDNQEVLQILAAAASKNHSVHFKNVDLFNVSGKTEATNGMIEYKAGSGVTGTLGKLTVLLLQSQFFTSHLEEDEAHGANIKASDECSEVLVQALHMLYVLNKLNKFRLSVAGSPDTLAINNGTAIFLQADFDEIRIIRDISEGDFTADAINEATNKAGIPDAAKFVYTDPEDEDKLKTSTWANIKAKMKIAFESAYAMWKVVDEKVQLITAKALNMQSKKIEGLADGVDPTDGVNKSQLDGVQGEIPDASNADPQDHGAKAPGISDDYSRADHVHESDNTDTDTTYTAGDGINITEANEIENIDKGSDAIVIDATLFDGNLDETVINLQLLADAVDALTVAGGGHTIQDAGTAKTQRTNLNLVGFTVEDDEVNDATKVTNPATGEDGHVLQDHEGVALTQRANFRGVGGVIFKNPASVDYSTASLDTTINLGNDTDAGTERLIEAKGSEANIDVFAKPKGTGKFGSKSWEGTGERVVTADADGKGKADKELIDQRIDIPSTADIVTEVWIGTLYESDDATYKVVAEVGQWGHQGDWKYTCVGIDAVTENSIFSRKALTTLKIDIPETADIVQNKWDDYEYISDGSSTGNALIAKVGEWGIYDGWKYMCVNLNGTNSVFIREVHVLDRVPFYMDGQTDTITSLMSNLSNNDNWDEGGDTDIWEGDTETGGDFNQTDLGLNDAEYNDYLNMLGYQHSDGDYIYYRTPKNTYNFFSHYRRISIKTT